MPDSNRVMIKVQPGAAALALGDSRANLRPLFETPATQGFGLSSTPTWLLADLPDGGPTPWDASHARVADQLGIAPSDVLFIEPDLAQSYPDENERNPGGQPFAVTGDCNPRPQATTFKRIKGPDIFAWHLGDDFSQLGSARNQVQFTDPRTRIAHVDTGYDKSHIARPERLLEDLERNFVDGNNQPNNAGDPNRMHMFDNSGHGTGTSGILAGGKVPQNNNDYLGGAPHADILPVRIADSVILFFTSAFARAIQYAVQQNCDIVSISMGGLPSSAWNDAVNAAYEAGICIVAASGDCKGGLPSHNVVYPARYHRVIAACGVMANGAPYYDLPIDTIEGSWGPASSMRQALTAYAPNSPWARIGCSPTIDLDGAGTSSTTPQIAAAAALWYEKYKALLPRDWRRVESVRNALFKSAKPGDPKYFGNGILQALKALDIAPMLNLPKTPADDDSFSFFRVITGLGVTDVPAREGMFNLELTQRWLRNPALQDAVPDPEESVSTKALQAFMDAAIHDPEASIALRKHLANRYPLVFGTSVQGAPPEVVSPPKAACQPQPKLPTPAFRRIRAYAVDPSFSNRLDTFATNEVTMKVRWEPLAPGPKGDYLEVIDLDAAGNTYAPVDLNNASLLAQDGLAPSEGNPGFHQQMVYAIAMTTIGFFERALGRPVLWRPSTDGAYTPRLKIGPHALHAANAFYSPTQIGLQFGYFEASPDDPGDHVPGSTVFTCLSHDIVAHETTHAILDGMHRRFNEPTNPDVLALHEGFADIVALMQHFTLPDILEAEIGRTRGDLESESMLGSLAVQFGRATGSRGALRDAIGKVDANGQWVRLKPDPADLQKQTAPHTRGAILVAAVFDAFLAIYKTRSADLYRIYTGGTGTLPTGAIHPDLVHRLAGEASKSARHVLDMCIRALDYVPPVDITFGEYLRGIITADSDLVPDDPYNYRVAFVEAFRQRGIYPVGLATLSVDTLRWRGVDVTLSEDKYGAILEQLKSYANDCFYLLDRQQLFEETRKQRGMLLKTLQSLFSSSPDFAAQFGIDPTVGFDVHEMRRSIRIGPDGQHKPQVIVALTQTKTFQVPGIAAAQTFNGGSTVIVDLAAPSVEYSIIKPIHSATRQERTAAFLTGALADPLQALLLAPGREEPFAALHALADAGDF